MKIHNLMIIIIIKKIVYLFPFLPKITSITTANDTKKVMVYENN